MKRILLVDDERPVLDHLLGIITRDLADEFTVVGTASSGREALEKVPVLQPDLVVLDVLMPGLTGLDTIRELLRRGTSAAFLLSTAYERFDIARDALELGVVGYLLKPVARDKLARALRSAAALQERRSELERKEFGFHEQDRLLKHFAASSWLSQLMLGQLPPEGDRKLLAELGWNQGFAVLGAVDLGDRPAAWQELSTTLHYKTQVLCSPPVGKRCALLILLPNPDRATVAQNEVLALLGHEIRVAWGDPGPAARLAHSWHQALTRLARPVDAAPGVSLPDFNVEGTVAEALVQGDAPGAMAALDRLLLPLSQQESVPIAERYRLIALLGWCCGLATRRGAVLGEGWLEFDDLREAGDTNELLLAVRSRLAVLATALAAVPRWSPETTQVMTWVKAHLSQPLTLETVASQLSLSPKRVSRLLVEALGQGFSEFLIAVRLEKARSLLLLPGASIKRVSAACGYADPNYFSRLFKQQVGLAPSEYRAEKLGDLDYSPESLS